MLDTVVSFLWSSDMGGHTFVGKELEAETAQSFIDLIYETKDGYLSCAAFRRVDWEKLSDALGHPEWKDDERFQNSAGLEKHKDARLKMTQEALLTRTTAEWISRLEEFDVPCAPVLTRKQMRQHEQIEANGIVEINTHPVAGELRQTRHAARFEGHAAGTSARRTTARGTYRRSAVRGRIYRGRDRSDARIGCGNARPEGLTTCVAALVDHSGGGASPAAENNAGASTCRRPWS